MIVPAHRPKAPMRPRCGTKSRRKARQAALPSQSTGDLTVDPAMKAEQFHRQSASGMRTTKIGTKKTCKRVNLAPNASIYR